ncbi:hypothetical protein DY000_02041424 [Brassica cretica]|uniref:Uncharacterized protein n=1 Tax=Brassica cretica TaxID=69181 RepID=A0ABQ7BDC3_BRACR|nr:hypothetical protein DY000_02041424 [Brassica cretica]
MAKNINSVSITVLLFVLLVASTKILKSEAQTFCFECGPVPFLGTNADCFNCCKTKYGSPPVRRCDTIRPRVLCGRGLVLASQKCRFNDDQIRPRQRRGRGGTGSQSRDSRHIQDSASPHSSYHTSPSPFPASALLAPAAAPAPAPPGPLGVMSVAELVRQPGRDHLPYLTPFNRSGNGISAWINRMMYSALDKGHPTFTDFPTDKQHLWSNDDQTRPRQRRGGRGGTGSQSRDSSQIQDSASPHSSYHTSPSAAPAPAPLAPAAAPAPAPPGPPGVMSVAELVRQPGRDHLPYLTLFNRFGNGISAWINRMMYSALDKGHPTFTDFPTDKQHLWFRQFAVRLWNDIDRFLFRSTDGQTRPRQRRGRGGKGSQSRDSTHIQDSASPHSSYHTSPSPFSASAPLAPAAAPPGPPGVMSVAELVRQPGRDHLPYLTPYSHGRGQTWFNRSGNGISAWINRMMYSALDKGHPTFTDFPSEKQHLWFRQFADGLCLVCKER